MAWLRSTFNSTIGMKWLMGLTGLFLTLFVFAHMLGNLQVYLGPEALNSYSDTLQHLGEFLWLMRLGLLTIFVVHIISAVRLSQLNRSARPERYAVITPQVSRYASRTMLMGGLIVLGFVVYHLAHFTLGLVNPEQYHLTDAKGRHDVYAMVVLGFRQPLIAFSYILAMVPLMLHLQHGASSFFQSLGLNYPKYNYIFRAVGPVLSAIIFIGNCSIPLAILAGLVPYPVAGH
ncbi:MAG TPA: succinate dehydrogenase cytochrome b subunit [Candidatus Acidoferrales bacterium]|nr:succinate dehydrogenase cytochrome b subunit [Candidatus Acidoferrales bacterium]